MTFDPTFLSNLILVLTAFGGAFLAALWVSLVVWTYRDIRSRARDPLVHTLSALLVAVLNVPGVLVYLILRPPRTLEEEYQRLDVPERCSGKIRHLLDGVARLVA